MDRVYSHHRNRLHLLSRVEGIFCEPGSRVANSNSREGPHSPVFYSRQPSGRDDFGYGPSLACRLTVLFRTHAISVPGIAHRATPAHARGGDA